MAIMLASLLINKYVYGGVMLFALIVMIYEFLRMTCGTQYKYSQILAIVAGAFIFLMTFLYKGFHIPGRLVILCFVPVFILMINSLYVKDKTSFGKFASLYTAILYIAIPWAIMCFTVLDQDGNFDGRMLLSFFAIIWGSDVGAYVFGISLGQKYGKKLFPSISPKKSWIGFWGGMLTAVIVAVILQLTGVFPVSMVHAIVLSLLMDVAGVYGDLIESQWKRYTEVKDSGIIIPGHGGMLDRFDSALMAIPTGVIYLVLFNLI